MVRSLGLLAVADLQPANILFSVAGSQSSQALLQPPEFSPVQWLQGTTADDSAPEYLIASQRRRGQLDDAELDSLNVVIGDLGGGKISPSSIKRHETLSHNLAVWRDRCDHCPVTPKALRAPELIRAEAWDASIDIWALACVVRTLPVVSVESLV